MKKLFVVLIAVAAIVSLAANAFAEAPTIKRVEYDGRGYVDVDFVYDVQYNDVQVSVSDADGFVYNAVVRERDEDDISFTVDNIVAGNEYSFIISGVRSGYSGSYESVNGTFTVPAAGEVLIKSFDYDREDRELEIEFSSGVEYSNPVVRLEDASGASYEARILEKDRDSLEVRVGKLTRGNEYTVFVDGIVYEGAAINVSGNFTAR